MPNLRRFLKEGAYADGVQGVVPTVTYPSHTTLMTGVWPAKHGIFGKHDIRSAAEKLSGLVLVCGRYSRADAVGCGGEGGANDGEHSVAGDGGRDTSPGTFRRFWRANTPDDAKLLRAVSTPGLLAEARIGDRAVQRRN